MKRSLLLCLSVFIMSASIAAPWDIKTPTKQHVNHAAWDKPLFAYLDSWDVSYINLNTVIHFQMELNTWAPVRHKITLYMGGCWNGIPDCDVKFFDIFINQGSKVGTLNYTLQSGDQPAIGYYNFYYDGPA